MKRRKRQLNKAEALQHKDQEELDDYPPLTLSNELIVCALLLVSSTLLSIVLVYLGIHGTPQRFGGGYELLDSKMPWEDIIGEESAQVRAGTSDVPLADYESTRCDFDRVASRKMTPSLFMSKYFLKSPVIISGAASYWPAFDRWRRGSLYERYGDFDVRVGTSSQIVTNEGNGVTSMPLKDYLRLMRFKGNITDILPSSFHHLSEAYKSSFPDPIDPDELLYLFDRDGYLFTQPKELIDDIIWPEFLESAHASSRTPSLSHYSLYFIAGPNASGVPLHIHSDGINALIFGQKHWIFYNSSHTIPHYPVPTGHFEWLNSTVKRIPANQRPFQCVQYAGDILYVPEAWAHGTYSMGETIGMSAQAKLPITEGLQMLHHAFDQFNSGLDGQTRNLDSWLQETLRTTEEAIKLVPSEAFRALEVAASTYAILGKMEEASKLIDRSIELNPYHARSFLVRGHIHLMQGREEEAISALSHAIMIDPKFARAHYEIAMAFNRLGNMTGAQYHIDIAADLKPSEYAQTAVDFGVPFWQMLQEKARVKKHRRPTR